MPLSLLPRENLQPLPERLAVEHLLGEERRVSRDGFISWGGARCGVPWPYAGGHLVVKERGALLEFWAPGRTEPVALHARAVQGRTVLEPGQYEGIPLGQAARQQESLAQQLAGPEVEQRPLSAYYVLGVAG